jgi:hypothetical protein
MVKINFKAIPIRGDNYGAWMNRDLYAIKSVGSADESPETTAGNDQRFFGSGGDKNSKMVRCPSQGESPCVSRKTLSRDTDQESDFDSNWSNDEEEAIRLFSRFEDRFVVQKMASERSLPDDLETEQSSSPNIPNISSTAVNQPRDHDYSEPLKSPVAVKSPAPDKSGAGNYSTASSSPQSEATPFTSDASSTYISEKLGICLTPDDESFGFDSDRWSYPQTPLNGSRTTSAGLDLTLHDVEYYSSMGFASSDDSDISTNVDPITPEVAREAFFNNGYKPGLQQTNPVEEEVPGAVIDKEMPHEAVRRDSLMASVATSTVTERVVNTAVPPNALHSKWSNVELFFLSLIVVSAASLLIILIFLLT